VIRIATGGFATKQTDAAARLLSFFIYQAKLSQRAYSA
jgi:hypothetical protein